MGERLTYHAAPGAIGVAGQDMIDADAHGEEVIVVDTRGQLRPAEMVERKLVHLLRGVPMPVSHVSASMRRR
jgi:hypothetical protein